MIRILKFGAGAVAGALLAFPVTAQNLANGMGSQTGQNSNTDQNGNYYGDQNRPTVQGWNPSNNSGQGNQSANGGQGWNSGQNSGTGFNGQNGNRFGQNGSGNPDQSNPSLVFQQMHNMTQDLQQAGYSNVQIMPESFLVSAQDPQGRR